MAINEIKIISINPPTVWISHSANSFSCGLAFWTTAWRLSEDNCQRLLIGLPIIGQSFTFSGGLGIFNVSLKTEPSVWKAYCEETIIKMWQSAQQGIMFNMLSIDSEPERRQRHLTYFDPSDWLRFVREHLSAHVRLDQSYGQFDFSVAVFRSASSTSQRDIAVWIKVWFRSDC